MYLYYDKKNVLKEIINDKAIVSNSVKANKIYVMYESDQEESGYDISYIKYQKDSGEVSDYYFQNGVTNPHALIPSDECYIPFDENRDLKFFKYGKAYRFRIFTIPSEVLTGTKSILGSVWYIIDPDSNTEIDDGEVINSSDDTTEALTEFAFAVNPSTGSVDLSKNINLEQWNQLLLMISKLGVQDVEQLKRDVLTLQSYFLNGSALDALSLDGYAASHYATQSDIETLQNAINAIKQLTIVIPTTAAECPNVAEITVGGTTIQGTLVPSESTLYKLYLCNDPENPVTTDMYTEYLTTKTFDTIENEYVYKWEKFGTTPSSIVSAGVESIGGASGTITLENELQMISNALGIKGLPVVTTAPVANNTSGVYKIAILNSRPATRYSGYIYIITEA